jgi:hypothetical protein
MYVVSLGYDYNMVLDWNIGAFFDMTHIMGKMLKAKSGVK